MRRTGHLDKLPRAVRNIISGIVIVLKAALLVPIPLFMIWFNFSVDRSGLFHGERYEREVALALIEGKNLTGYDQLDERKVAEMYAENITAAPDTLALGSSRILQMTEGISGAESFYNGGMSGGDIRDMMGTFYLFEKAGHLPKNLVLSLDPWLLSNDPDAFSNRSDVALYNEFLTLKLNIDAGYVPPDNTAKYQALFSPSYFQGNVAYYRRDQSLERKPSEITGDLRKQPNNVKMWDGSVLYDREFREKNQNDINSLAMLEATTFVRLEEFTELDADMCDLFARFVEYVQGQGVNVVFVMMPYHPYVYTYATEYVHNYPAFFMAEPWFSQYALKHNIPLYGSYNPYVTDTLEEDFYDGLHIKGEAISFFFPGVEKVLAEQRRGKASSPWVYSAPRVGYDMAHELISRRYEVPVSQPLVRAEDGTIYDEFCYVLHRYESDEKDAVLLASYAVSQSNGTIYRLNHNVEEDTKNWVIYRQFT